MKAKGKMQATIQWVDAARELPDDEITVLMALSDGEVWTGFHEDNAWRFVSADLVDQGNGVIVTHWAELPAHPGNMRGNDSSSATGPNEH